MTLKPTKSPLPPLKEYYTAFWTSAPAVHTSNCLWTRHWTPKLSALHDNSSSVCVLHNFCRSRSEHFNLNYNTALFYYWVNLLINLMQRHWFLSACQCVSTERDSLPVWPCGKPSLLKLEAANEQANTNHRCTWSCVKGYICVCVCRSYCWNIKVPPWWMAGISKTRESASTACGIHTSIYLHATKKLKVFL